MKKFIKENKWSMLGIIIFLLVALLVPTIGNLLIKSGNGWLVLEILVFAIFWIIWLYISKGEIKTRYERFKKFSFKFYKEVSKTKATKDCGYDHGDYTLGDFEDEFEEWLRNDIEP